MSWGRGQGPEAPVRYMVRSAHPTRLRVLSGRGGGSLNAPICLPSIPPGLIYRAAYGRHNPAGTARPINLMNYPFDF